MPKIEGEKVTIELGEGSEVTYIMRGLHEDELDKWTAFCASVFAYKANPPPASYFGRHYYNDPLKSAKLIRVMFYGSEIVASCRVFRRSISTGGSENPDLLAGGIGEVCTDSNHRRRGLSKLLLQDAIRIMTEQNMQISLLHAAPAFFSVYQSSGYACTTSRWSLIDVNRKKIAFPGESAGDFTLALAEFPSDTERLMELHQRFTELRFAGSIIRSKRYWNEYLSKELGGTLWVLKSLSGSLTAWISVRIRGENICQIREFGCDLEVFEDNSVFARVFSLLLYQATQKLLELSTEVFTLHFPTFLLDTLRGDKPGTPFLDWSTECAEDDEGWMYKPLAGSQIEMPKINEHFPHLIWPADSF